MTPILTNQPFDTNSFFSGGAGLFLQYHDVIKPTYLYAVIQMMITKQTYGLPVYTIEKMSQLATVEWYLNRRYRKKKKNWMPYWITSWKRTQPSTRLLLLLPP